MSWAPFLCGTVFGWALLLALLLLAPGSKGDET